MGKVGLQVSRGGLGVRRKSKQAKNATISTSLWLRKRLEGRMAEIGVQCLSVKEYLGLELMARGTRSRPVQQRRRAKASAQARRLSSLGSGKKQLGPKGDH